MAEKKKTNMLDDVKELDRKVRKHLVYKKLDDFRDWAREVLELKEKTKVWLEELGVEDTDIKRIIDYVNEDVALTEEDKKEIRVRIKASLIAERKTLQKEVKLLPFAYAMSADATSGNYITCDSSDTTTNATWTGIDCATAGTTDLDFEIK